MTSKGPTGDSPSNKFAWVNLEDFEAICFSLAREHLTFDQPIPDFITRNPGVLESCLQTPLQFFNGKELYSGLVGKLAILFYLMIKNHPFQNGNKRIAVTTVLTILYLNNKWLKASGLEIYRLGKRVSSSDRKNKDIELRKIKRFILKNIYTIRSRQIS